MTPSNDGGTLQTYHHRASDCARRPPFLISIKNSIIRLIAPFVFMIALLTANVAATSCPGDPPVTATTTWAEAHPPKVSPSNEQKFLQENAASMATMMRGMHSQPTGDIDRDFVRQMIPHHQGAIDMAKTLLKSGHNERLKRLAQEIIITQQEEIEVMRLLVTEQVSETSYQRTRVLRRAGAPSQPHVTSLRP